MKWLFIMLAGLTMMSCSKIPYDQYYVFENPTNETLVLYVNPPKNTNNNYYFFNPSAWVDDVWPPMVRTILEPHGKYTLHGTMACDYYDVWFAVWKYPPTQGDVPYWTGKTNYINSIPTK